jgi:hypothetical protein
MQIENVVVKRIIKRLLAAQDYREEVQLLLDSAFLDFTKGFLKEISEVRNKRSQKLDDMVWYTEHFLSPDKSKEDIAINSGLNMKTITNMFRSASRPIVLREAPKHFRRLIEVIKESIKNDDSGLSIGLSLTAGDRPLDTTETLWVMNVLSVKRAAIRGGLYSSAGKRVEKPLIHTLCLLWDVPSANFSYRSQNNEPLAVEGVDREIDFYLISNGRQFNCEVKLMGTGNPEGADAVIARDSGVFFGDKLSDQNKKQLDSLGIEWVELRSDLGFRRFLEVLNRLQIPNNGKTAFTVAEIEMALEKVLPATS